MIARDHFECKHLLMFCTNCHSIGCDNHTCKNSIGNGCYDVCKYCGARAVISNYRRNELVKNRKFEGIKHDQDIEHRMKQLEKLNDIHFQTHNRTSVHRPSIPIKSWVMFFGACWLISQVVNHKDYEGFLGLALGIVNICGALAEIPVAIIKDLIS